ncbi:MAG: hypothetical protein KGI69_03545 [Patescibacteria group bacterium]|nr:hypothetical protein [Patescibacteria group bacterium]
MNNDSDDGRLFTPAGRDMMIREMTRLYPNRKLERAEGGFVDASSGAPMPLTDEEMLVQYQKALLNPSWVSRESGPQ